MQERPFESAVQAFIAGRPTEALDTLISIDTTLPPPNYFTLMALCHGALGRSHDVLPLLRREVSSHPSNTTAQHLLTALEQGFTSEATTAANVLVEELLRQPQAPPSREESGPRSLGKDDLCAIFPEVEFGNGVQIIGLQNVELGRGSCVGDSTWLNVCCRDSAKRLRIGRCVLIGRQSFLSTGGFLELGDYCLLAPRVYISDADHTFADLTLPILAQPPTFERKLTVEENCWFGINTVVTGQLTVGRGSVIAANAVVLDDVPPFSVVAGNPARVIKMFDPVSGRWERTRTDEDVAAVLRSREKKPIPSREEYAATLRERAPFDRLDPVLAGRSLCF